jgi:hypothetical protein
VIEKRGIVEEKEGGGKRKAHSLKLPHWWLLWVVLWEAP